MPYKDPEKRRAQNKAYYENLTEDQKQRYRARSKAYSARYRKEKWEEVRESLYRYRKENTEVIKRIDRRKYHNRRAQIKSTYRPEERSEIEKLYDLRDQLTRETGVEHHVDHIIPLSKGGRHILGNLRVITAKENLKKADHFPEDLIVSAVIDRVCSRATQGIRTYGVPMTREDVSTVEWLRHAQEEALDLAVYLERIIRDLSDNTPNQD